MRLEGQKKLFEIADLVIDNCVPRRWDAPNRRRTYWSRLNYSRCFIVNLMATEAMKTATQKGVKLPVYYSQNIDGFDNETL